MPFIEFPNDAPWCTGRTYCNGPAESKIQCLVRPPPFWWIVEYDGFAPAFADLNGESIAFPYRVATGLNTFVQWIKKYPSHVPFRTIIEWGPDPINVGKRWFLIHFENPPSLTQHKLWGWNNLGPGNDWMADWDDTTPPLTFTSPLWGLGDVTVQLKVGTYARVPAHSCRGDYGGEWP